MPKADVCLHCHVSRGSIITSRGHNHLHKAQAATFYQHMTPSMDFEMETNISVSNRCRVVGIEGENHSKTVAETPFVSTDPISSAPRHQRMSPGTALPGYAQHHLHLQHLWRHLGLEGPSKGEKWCYRVPFSPCSHLSAVLSHPSLSPPAAWDSRSLCIVLHLIAFTDLSKHVQQ